MENVTFSNCSSDFGYLFNINYQNENQNLKLTNITLESIY